MLKRILVFFACVLPLTAFAQDLKIGYYNRVEFVQNMPEFIAANNKLKQMDQDYGKELNLIKEEYTKKYKEYIAGKDTMPEAIRLRRESEIQDLEGRYQAFVEDSGTSMKTKESELINPILKKLDATIKEIGKENGFILIFDTTVLAYFSLEKCTDVTNLLRTKLGIK